MTGCICDTGNIVKDVTTKLAYEANWKLFVQKSYCICLKDREDRMLEASEEFHRYGLCRIVQFYRPTVPTVEHILERGIKRRSGYGCWESHRSVIHKAFVEKFDNVLVFEDDIHFLPALMNVGRINSISKNYHLLPEDSDVYYLGQFPYFGVKYNNHIYSTRSLAAHAYVMQKTGMQKLLQTGYLAEMDIANGKEPQIDGWYSKNLKQYSYYPQIAVQSDSPSSNISPNTAILEAMEKRWKEHSINFYNNNAHRIEKTTYIASWVLPLLILLIIGLAAISAVLILSKKETTTKNELPRPQITDQNFTK